MVKAGATGLRDSRGSVGFPLEDGLVLFGRGPDGLAVLNPTARLIWEAHEQGEGPDRIANRLAERYGISCGLARRDVAAFLSLRERANGGASRVWHEQSYRLFDRLFHVRASTPYLWESVERLVGHLAADVEAAPGPIAELVEEEDGCALRLDGKTMVAAGDRDGAVVALHGALLQLGCRRDWLVAMHAAGVSDGARSIVLPGLGGSGKSTLTAVLLKAGLVYLSDDVVPLERRSLRAVPLPVSLNLKPGSLPVLARYFPDIESLPSYSCQEGRVHFLRPSGFELNPPLGTYPIGHIIFPRYRPNEATTLEDIPATEALRLLVESESLLPRPLTAEVVGELVEWIGSVPAHTLVYSDVDEAASWVMTLFG